VWFTDSQGFEVVSYKKTHLATCGQIMKHVQVVDGCQWFRDDDVDVLANDIPAIVTKHSQGCVKRHRIKGLLTKNRTSVKITHP
jgi:hypothetical protein